MAAACRSSLCVDGVCCDKACGTCEACTAAKKGSGADGTCGPIADGNDPDKECTAQSCSAGVVTKPQVCNDAGVCRSDGTTACGLYGCAGISCATTCATDCECGTSARCVGTTCTTDLDLGGACARPSQCKSGFCADSVCCDKACTGNCEACTATKKGSGTDGTCSNVLADTDPRDKCTADPTSTCDGLGACAVGFKCDTNVCAPSTSSTDESGGCGCETGPRPGTGSLAAIPFALLVLMRRRRAR